MERQRSTGRARLVLPTREERPIRSSVTSIVRSRAILPASRPANTQRKFQVRDREEREERFRNGQLAVLYCSPTMELGVDIFRPLGGKYAECAPYPRRTTRREAVGQVGVASRLSFLRTAPR